MIQSISGNGKACFYGGRPVFCLLGKLDFNSRGSDPFIRELIVADMQVQLLRQSSDKCRGISYPTKTDMKPCCDIAYI